MNNKVDQIPEEFKQLADDFSKNGFITTSLDNFCLLYTSPSPRDVEESRMPSSA